MTLKPESYRPRLLDGHIADTLKAFGAVEIIGTMWCGKTWAALAQGMSVAHLDNEREQEVARTDPALTLTGDQPRILDEWQEVPSLWDATRRAIDEAGNRPGQYILTGSSTPAKDSVTHSGTGRIARMTLRPFSLLEAGESDGSVSLAGLFEGELRTGATTTDLVRLAELVCHGGWPAALSREPQYQPLIPQQYLDTFVSSATAKKLNEYVLRAVLRSLARNTGAPVSKTTLAADVAGALVTRPDAPRSETVINQHLNYLKDRFLIEEHGGWAAPVRAVSRVRTNPQFSFVDPSLPAALLGQSPARLLNDMQLFGRLFEELCLRDLRVYASALDLALPDPVRYYRDSDGLEVDAIIELRDGRWAAIEIKLSDDKVDKGVRNLMRLRDKVRANPLAQNPEPAFMAVLVGKTGYVRKTPEGVYVFPVTALGA
ncbi:MAG: ATP-binding protein [Coriobacteriia bacterium]|nr:ATP-binding protein [Coriobacteriia bacterium]